MKTLLSKTDYILYRECPKNVWYKIHKPEIYSQSELSDFERTIMETGNDVEEVARTLFPTGILIERRDTKGEEATLGYLSKKQEALFQPIFVKDGYLATIDILKFDPKTNSYSVFEVKSTTKVDEKMHYHDLAFQINVLRSYGLKVTRACLIHLNSEYVRSGDLDITQLFKFVDVSSEVESVAGSVAAEMAEALKYISQDSEPGGYCSCIYKGRSRHCSTFKHANPQVPEYSIHDIARLGTSKAKLKELVDSNVFHVDKIPAHIKLSDIQQRQVDTYVLNKVFINKEGIVEEFKSLYFPLYFLDYETFPCAIPRFDGFSPYQQIPFQYSIHVLEATDKEPKHYEFLHTTSDDPTGPLVKSLQSHIGNTGSIIVWSKQFECSRNEEIAIRIPQSKAFMESVNDRVYDLEDIFKKQYHVHKDFRGSTSIKRVLPVLVPELTYKDLTIRDGGSAADTWNKITSGLFSDKEKEQAIKDLKKYCALDTFAMYSIWHVLHKLLR
jgi:hypothetical protein